MKELKEIKFRIENLELRSCDINLIERKELTTMTISRWSGDSRVEIAYWIMNKDKNFHLNFVGNRPMSNNVSKNDLWFLIEVGQKFLDEYSKELKYEEGWI